jgi:putative hydrolase of the HAD superfamily
MLLVPESLVAIPATVDLLHRLQANGHKLFCLSNMQIESIEYLEEKYSFWSVFEGMVISCRTHLIKPEPEIYQYLLATHDLSATETVFIDDTSANVEAAAKFGMRTIQFEDAQQCEEELRAMGYV